ncbi:MAG: hypothetical protein ABI402_08625 [Ferruginibacter sp.]
MNQHAMKILTLLIFIFLFFSFRNIEPGSRHTTNTNRGDTIPFMFGYFNDDYDILYTINDSLWIQQPGIKYHILKWNKKEQYCIAKNDDKNPSEAGLYTRIDYMQFKNMKPWLWGFCYTAYKAKNDSIAEHALAADRSNPKKGCKGYPFSRMKKVNE